MKNIQVALLQQLPEADLEGNRKKGEVVCRRAKAMGADIAVFPEMWSIGYQLEADAEAMQQKAISREHPFVRSFAQLAKEYRHG